MKKLFYSIRSFLTPSYDWIPVSEKSFEVPPVTNSKTFAYCYSGKLLLRQEIPLEAPIFNSLLATNCFTAVSGLEKHPWGHRCRRCGNRARHLFAEMPCARCRSHHVYCRKCIEMGRITACDPLYIWTGPAPVWPAVTNPCAWQGKLSKFQQKASDQINETMKAGNGELLVWAVCGAGKTEMLFQGISQALEQGKRICLATPRTDVVRELLPRFRSAFPAVSIEGLYGGSEEKDGKAQIILATTHQLLRFAHAFEVLIIDEIDAFPYHKDPSLPLAAERAAKPDAARIYLTATPRKAQRKKVENRQLPAVFVPIRFHENLLPVPKLQICYALKKSLKSDQPPPAFFHWFEKRQRPERQLLIFVPEVKLADKLAAILTVIWHDQPVTSVHASDPQRKEKVQQFREQKLFILITTTILERGVTFPSVDVVVLDAGHRVFDEAALIQIAGRAGRSPADPTGEVTFYHDGKTEAMLRAVRSIEKMNQRAGKL